LSARLAARPETRGRTQQNSTYRRARNCHGHRYAKVKMSCVSPRMLGFASVICQCRDLPVLMLSGQEYRSFTRRRRRSPIYASSQRPGLNECSKPLYAQGRASSAAYGNRFVSGFCLLSTPWRLIPPLRCPLLVVSVVMDQCAVAVPNAPMKHLGVLPVHKSRRRPSRAAWQSRRGQEMLV
jgi:hypothetical protein